MFQKDKAYITLAQLPGMARRNPRLFLKMMWCAFAFHFLERHFVSRWSTERQGWDCRACGAPQWRVF